MANMITVLGVGNLLMRDEGFGPQLISYLQANYTMPAGVDLVDGGTSGIYLAPTVEDSEKLLVIDALAMDGPAGEIHQIDGCDLNGAGLQLRMSPHQVGLLEIMDICRLRGHIPAEVKFIGIIPAKVELGMELSPALQDKIEPVSQLVIRQIEEWTDARVISGSEPA
jgi:hydrogenase maturation protease